MRKILLIVFVLVCSCTSSQHTLQGIANIPGMETMVPGQTLSFELEGMRTEITKLDEKNTAYIEQEQPKEKKPQAKGSLINVEISKVKDKSTTNSHNKDKSETHTNSHNRHKEKNGGGGLWPYLIAVGAGMLLSKLIRVYIPLLGTVL